VPPRPPGGRWRPRRGRGCGVAEEGALGSRGRRSGRLARVEAPAVGLGFAAVGVVRVEAAGYAEHRGGVGGGQGEDRDRVQAAAGRHHAAGGQQAAGGLEPDQVVEGGRHPAGAGGVGAQGEADLTRHGHRRARAGAAGDVGGLEGVAAGAVGRAGAVEAGGELVQVGLAEGMAPAAISRATTGASAAARRRVRAAGGGRQAGQVDVVLDREGHAVQRQAGRVLASSARARASSSASGSRLIQAWWVSAAAGRAGGRTGRWA
jgi:hypothetical protein